MALRADAIDLTGSKATSVPQHRKILAAIRAGNGGQAARAMAAHGHATAQEMRSIIDGPVKR
jgi:DNA-binding FadR family transcriptional regulator